MTNHESYGGDWSVAAVLKVLYVRGYVIKRAVKSGTTREWCGETIENMMTQSNFRGFIIHLPQNHHFTCIRPEEVNGERHLYYVDSQSTGPIRISPRLATRRCLAAAYAWEPFLVQGPEMDFVEAEQFPISEQFTNSVYEGLGDGSERAKFRPTAEFLREWEDLSSRTNTQPKQRELSENTNTKEVYHYIQTDK